MLITNASIYISDMSTCCKKSPLDSTNLYHNYEPAYYGQAAEQIKGKQNYLQYNSETTIFIDKGLVNIMSKHCMFINFKSHDNSGLKNSLIMLR